MQQAVASDGLAPETIGLGPLPMPPRGIPSIKDKFACRSSDEFGDVFGQSAQAQEGEVDLVGANLRAQLREHNLKNTRGQPEHVHPLRFRSARLEHD
eukprot:7397958-Pyramimonas_sp.AAC.1